MALDHIRVEKVRGVLSTHSLSTLDCGCDVTSCSKFLPLLISEDTLKHGAERGLQGGLSQPYIQGCPTLSCMFSAMFHPHSCSSLALLESRVMRMVPADMGAQGCTSLNPCTWNIRSYKPSPFHVPSVKKRNSEMSSLCLEITQGETA